MKQTTTIDFTANVTTWEAFAYIGRFSAVIIRNLLRTVDKAAHRWPWAFIFAVLLASTVTCFMLIGQARAERDHYNQINVRLQQQVDSYKAAFGEKGGK